MDPLALIGTAIHWAVALLLLAAMLLGGLIVLGAVGLYLWGIWTLLCTVGSTIKRRLVGR